MIIGNQFSTFEVFIKIELFPKLFRKLIGNLDSLNSLDVTYLLSLGIHLGVENTLKIKFIVPTDLR